MKKVISILLAMTLLLSLVGCGGGEAKEKVETNYKSDFHYEKTEFKGGEGNISAVTEGSSEEIYALVDGNILREYLEDGSYKDLKIQETDNNKIKEVAVGKIDGKTMFIYNKYDQESEGRKIYLVSFSKEGDIENKVDITDEIEVDSMYYNSSFSTIKSYNNNLLVSLDGELMTLDKEGKKVETILPRILDFDLNENKIYAIQVTEEYKLNYIKYDLEKRELEVEKDLGTSMGFYKIDFDSTEKQVMLFNGKSEMISLDEDGNKVETLIDDVVVPEILNQIAMTGFAKNKNGDVYLSFTDFTGVDFTKMDQENPQPIPTSLIKVVKKEGKSNRKKRNVLKIGINMDYESFFYKTYADEYMKANPEVKIEFVNYEYDKYAYGGDVNDYVKKINAKLMAGDGEDLIPVKYLPFKKYVRSGVFEPITDEVKKVMNSNEYFNNLFEATKVGEDYYQYPLLFKLSGIVADKKIAQEIDIDNIKWDIDGFKEAMKKTKEINKFGMAAVNKQDIFRMLIKGNLNEYIDYENKKSNFNSEKFRKLLSDIDQIFESGSINEEIDQDRLLFEGTKGEILLKEQAEMGVFSFNQMKNDFENGWRLIPYPSSDGAGAFGFDADTYAINAASQNKEVAMDFIKFMTKEETYLKQSFSFSIPANKAATDKMLVKLKDIEERVDMAFETEYGLKEMKSYPLLDEELKDINKAMEQSKININIEPKLSKIIFENADKYFKGEIELEDFISDIQSKCETYLNE